MFTLSEFKLSGRKCPDEMMRLFESLGLRFPGWDRLEANSQEWDRKIVNEVCSLMGSDTISDGYVKLLKAAGISYRIGNPDDMLASIVSHESEIIAAATKPSAGYSMSSMSEKSFDSLRTLILDQLDEAKSPDFAKLLNELPMNKLPKLKPAIEQVRKTVAGLPSKIYLDEKLTPQPVKSLYDLPIGQPVIFHRSEAASIFTTKEDAERLLAVLGQLHSIKSKI